MESPVYWEAPNTDNIGSLSVLMEALVILSSILQHSLS